MNVYLLLVIVPVAWGVLGIRRGRMQISKFNELQQPHLMRFAIGLILIPTVVVLLCGVLHFVATRFLGFEKQDVHWILIAGMVVLPTSIALLLTRAKKHAVLIREKFETIGINSNEVEEQTADPDFSFLKDQD